MKKWFINKIREILSFFVKRRKCRIFIINENKNLLCEMKREIKREHKNVSIDTYTSYKKLFYKVTVNKESNRKYRSGIICFSENKNNDLFGKLLKNIDPKLKIIDMTDKTNGYKNLKISS